MSVDLRKEEKNQLEIFLSLLAKRKEEIAKREWASTAVSSYNTDCTKMLSDWFSKTANRIRRHIFITITESKAHIGIVHRTKQKPKREGRIFDFGTEVSTPFLISSPLKLLTWIKIVEANLRWLAKYTPYPNDITLQPTVRISIKTKDRYF